jgi:acyl-CoA thioester hydrolase
MAKVKIELPGEFIFKTEIPVRISDINYGGHLGNDSVLSIVHEARLRFLNRHNIIEFNANGPGIIMVDAAVEYKAESFYGDILIVEIGANDITGVGCEFVYRLTNKETKKIIALVKTGIVFYHYGKKKVISMPVEFKSELGGD